MKFAKYIPITLTSFIFACSGPVTERITTPSQSIEESSAQQGASKDAGGKASTPSTPVSPSPSPSPTAQVSPSPGAAQAVQPMPSTAPVLSADQEAIKKKCTPEIEFVTNASEGSKVFAKHVPDAKLAMVQAAHYVCSILYKTAAEVPVVKKVKLVIEDMEGVAYATGGNQASSKELHISSNYLSDINGDIKLEIDGVLIHENTHIWQISGQNTDGGLIEGVADYVRAGGAWYVPGSRNSSGGKYNDAYTTSAFFIGWVDEKYPGAAYKINLAMKNWPGASAFKTITGVDVNTLWAQYQKEGTFSPKVPTWQAKVVPLKLGL